ncbi:hypothetical protein Droror1_Dr00024553, partial [Drosera rotundifolia]
IPGYILIGYFEREIHAVNSSILRFRTLDLVHALIQVVEAQLFLDSKMKLDIVFDFK